MATSNRMGQLIPLRLQSQEPSVSTRASRFLSPSPPPLLPLPTLPTQSILRRPRPGPVTDLTIFPNTEQEWRKVMEEVRILYMKHQYKQCSARCIQILGSIKEPYRVHPLYQIYLSFFAASSLEETSRSLHPNSSIKLSLLKESLSHYQNAESHMEYASFSTDPALVGAVRKTHSSLSSRSSSVSSLNSIFSQTSSPSEASSAPSPTSSIFSSHTNTTDAPEMSTQQKRTAYRSPTNTLGEVNLVPALLKPKKKVAFSPQLPLTLSNDELEHTDDSDLITYFPAPPSSLSPSCPPSTSSSSIDDYLLSRSLHRYRSHLKDLHGQLNQHTQSVDHQIQALLKIRKAWRSNSPDLFTDLGNAGKGLVVEEGERKRVGLKARIERLRMTGWKRERFDGRRYEALCESALGQLEC